MTTENTTPEATTEVTQESPKTEPLKGNLSDTGATLEETAKAVETLTQPENTLSTGALKDVLNVFKELTAPPKATPTEPLKETPKEPKQDEGVQQTQAETKTETQATVDAKPLVDPDTAIDALCVLYKVPEQLKTLVKSMTPEKAAQYLTSQDYLKFIETLTTKATVEARGTEPPKATDKPKPKTTFADLQRDPNYVSDAFKGCFK